MAKNQDGYLSAKESRRISKENRRITDQYEKRRKRRNVPESEYTTQMKDPANAVEFDNLHTYFFTDTGVVKSVDGVSFEVPIGKTVGVVGESGCGKSVTSLSLMQLLQRPQGQIVEGAIRLNLGNDKAYDIAKGFVPQMGEGGASVEGRVVNSIIVKSRDQVMLKVTAAEVRRDVAKQFGLTSSSMTGKWGSFTQDNPLTLNVTQLSAGGLKLGQTGSPFASTLNAFERYGVTRVLAEPTVTTVSGETAKLTVGGEVPVPSSRTCDAGGCSVGVTFKPYGISLNFTPVVLAEGRILLRFTTEVTELDTQQSLSFNSISIPGFRTNKHETTVELPSGGSIASAGLLTSKTRQAIDGLPGLMNLPILGSLFRSRDYQRQESELLIIVTPYIAKHSNVADLTRPDDGLADASDPQSIFLGRVNRLYSTRSNPQAVQNFKGKVGFIQD